jgi:hypothetical protein
MGLELDHAVRVSGDLLSDLVVFWIAPVPPDLDFARDEELAAASEPKDGFESLADMRDDLVLELFRVLEQKRVMDLEKDLEIGGRVASAGKYSAWPD